MSLITAENLRGRSTMFHVAVIGLALLGAELSLRECRADQTSKPAPQAALAGSTNAQGQGATDCPAANSTRLANEARITKALVAHTELDFAEQPFSDVIEYLKTRHEIEIQLDQKALIDAGVGSDVPITRYIKGITLESALDLLLNDLDLTWVLHDEVMLITSKAAAATMIETRVYRVRDLVSPRAGEAPDADLPDYDSLAEVLSEAAATKEGTAECQTIRVYRPAGSLIITRPLVVHRRIEKLLSELRQARIDQ